MGLGLHVRYPDNLFNWILCMYIHKILDPAGEGVLEVWRRAEIKTRDVNIEVWTKTRCNDYTVIFLWCTTTTNTILLFLKCGEQVGVCTGVVQNYWISQNFKDNSEFCLRLCWVLFGLVMFWFDCLN